MNILIRACAMFGILNGGLIFLYALWFSKHNSYLSQGFYVIVAGCAIFGLVTDILSKLLEEKLFSRLFSKYAAYLEPNAIREIGWSKEIPKSIRSKLQGKIVPFLGSYLLIRNMYPSFLLGSIMLFTGATSFPHLYLNLANESGWIFLFIALPFYFLWQYLFERCATIVLEPEVLDRINYLSSQKRSGRSLGTAVEEQVCSNSDEQVAFLEGVLNLVNSYALKSCGECRIAKYLSLNYSDYFKSRVIIRPSPEKIEEIQTILEKLRKDAITYSETHRQPE